MGPCRTSDLPDLARLHWQLNKKQLAKLKVKVQANKEKVEKKLGRKLRLISKCKGGVCGGPDLPMSAAYTAAFCAAVCAAVFNSWIQGWVCLAKPN